MLTRTAWLAFAVVLWCIRPTLLAAYAVLCVMATAAALYLNRTARAVQFAGSMGSSESLRRTAMKQS